MNTSSYRLNEFVYCIRYANSVNGNGVDRDLDQLTIKEYIQVQQDTG